MPDMLGGTLLMNGTLLCSHLILAFIYTSGWPPLVAANQNQLFSHTPRPSIRSHGWRWIKRLVLTASWKYIAAPLLSLFWPRLEVQGLRVTFWWHCGRGNHGRLREFEYSVLIQLEGLRKALPASCQGKAERKSCLPFTLREGQNQDKCLVIWMRRSKVMYVIRRRREATYYLSCAYPVSIEVSSAPVRVTTPTYRA